MLIMLLCPLLQVGDLVLGAIAGDDLVELHGDGDPCSLNVALTDGDHFAAARFSTDAVNAQAMRVLRSPTATDTRHPVRQRSERAGAGGRPAA